MQETRDAGLIPGAGRSPGGGQGNPIWLSSLENPRTEEPSRLWSIGLQSQTELKRLSTYSWILLLRLYFFWRSFRLVAIWRALWRFPIQPYAYISLDFPITNISYQCGTFVTAEEPKQTYNHPVSISILQLTLVAVILRIWTNTSNFMILYRIFSPLKVNCALPIHFSPNQTSGSQYSFFCLHIFVFSKLSYLGVI